MLATAGNLNNAIGLPLTLLRLRNEHQVAVIELGMNHPGETAELAAIAQPTVALINNAQREHQEFMHSVAEVAAEHAALVRALPDGGIAVLNADDALRRRLARRRARAARRRGDRVRARSPGGGVAGAAASSPDGSLLELATPAGEVHGRRSRRRAATTRRTRSRPATAALAVGVPLAAVVRGLAGVPSGRGPPRHACAPRAARP